MLTSVDAQGDGSDPVREADLHADIAPTHDTEGTEQEPAALPKLDPPQITFLFRGNRVYSTVVPVMCDQLSAAGLPEVNAIEIPRGTGEADLRRILRERLPELTDRLLIADKTVARHLSGDSLRVHAQALDVLANEQLSAFLERHSLVEASRLSLAKAPKDMNTAWELLQVYHRIFKSLLESALQREEPAQVYILPHFLIHHDPFLQNAGFLLEEGQKSPVLSSDEADWMRAYLGRILTSLGDSHADTKMPERVRADLERVHGFHLLQPHDLVRRSLIDSGIDPQRIEVLHNSRRDLQAQDFLGSEPVWVIGDRHAFKYPEGDYVQRLSGMLEDDPRVRLLRLPLETFFLDLVEHDLLEFEGVPALTEIALGCANALAAQFLRK